MTQSDQTGGKFNIQIGKVSGSQVVVGDYNTVTQRLGLSPDEAAELRKVFSDFKTSVAADAPGHVRTEAVAQADELERAVVAEKPDVGTVRRVLRWFRDNAPQLAGAVVSVVINPLVGKLVEGAGTAIADRFQQFVQEEI